MTDFTVPRDSRRVPLATRVQLKFEWFGGFISEYSANISPGGIFIRTQTPEPVGRMIGFEFRLGDGFELIEGNGEVAWVRQLDESAEKPAGMGIRFLELSPHSRELIARMVENYIREGGTPFDVRDAPPPPAPPAVPLPAAPSPALAAPPAAPPAAAPVAPSARTPAPASHAEPAPVRAAPPPPESPRETVAPPSPAPPRRPAEPSPWPGLLAGSAAAPVIAPIAPAAAPIAPVPAPISAAELERTAVMRPVRPSRVVLWALFAVFLGGAAWVVLRQDDLLGWWMQRGGGAALSRPAASARALRLAATPRVVSSPAVAAPPPPVAAAGASPPATAPPKPAASAVSAGAAGTAGTAVTAASVPAPAPSAAAPLTEIEKITWQQGPDGTEVVVWGNGSFRRQDYVHYRIDGDPPRELIKLRGIQHPFADGRLIVGTRQVRQVRTGYHAEGAARELHVVLDLSGFGVELTGMQEDAQKLRIFLKGS